MKTMYISESMARRLRERVLMDSLPSFIVSSIEAGKTPFGKNNYFMGGGGEGNEYLLKASRSQFETAKNELKNIGKIESVDADTIQDAFSKIITRCQEIEAKNKNALEKLAVNYVVDLFSVPDNSIEIKAELVRDITDGDKISPVEPFDGDVDFKMQDMDDISGLKSEVAKKQFLNAINMGAGMRMSENVRGYLDDLYDIDSRLPQLYKEAIALNNYMIFSSPDLGISDKTRNQIGIVDVNFGSSDELVTISARGIIFPVMLCELIRGFMELFSSHGLPKDLGRAKYILSKTDFLKAEPWLMRIGPYMWNSFSECFGDTDTDDMPFIYQTISKLKPKVFFKVMSELLLNTEKGREYAKKIVEKATERKEYMSFNKKMSKKNVEKNIITDGHMSPEEF